jgi:hypothetical protein
MDVLAAIEKNRQPVVPIEDCSVRSYLQGSWLTRKQRGSYCTNREMPECSKLNWVYCRFGVQESQFRFLWGLQLGSNPKEDRNLMERLAGTTGLEPATSDVTGRRSNQLNYVPVSRTRRLFHPSTR